MACCLMAPSHHLIVPSNCLKPVLSLALLWCLSKIYYTPTQQSCCGVYWFHSIRPSICTSISTLSPCHTRVASSRRLHGVQEKLRTPSCAQWDLLECQGIAVASPLDAVGSPRTPCHGAHFVHAQSARRGSAFPRRSEWAPCERRGFAAATQ